MDDETRGRIVGHVLLAMVRFVCGAIAGYILFFWLASRLFAPFVDFESWFQPVWLAASILGGGLLAVLFGDRFFEWFIERLFGE